LPELTTNFESFQSVSALIRFVITEFGLLVAVGWKEKVPLLPHWPAWMVMISLFEMSVNGTLPSY
jgi:hypothetical protein